MSLEELGKDVQRAMVANINSLLKRKPKKKRPLLSLSSAGKCQRVAMYKILGAEEKAWGWRQRITLEDGDWGHDQLRKYMRKAFRTRSHFRLVKEEETVYLNIHGTKITGHIDGLITRICDCPAHESWPRSTLLEVKTASPNSYRYMLRDGVSSDYKAQATAYMGAMGITDCLFLLKNKGTGEFSFVPYKRDDSLLEEIFERYKRILAFKEGRRTDLDREHEPDSKGRLVFQCNYCPFVLKCWKEYAPKKVKAGVNVYQLSADITEVPGIKEILDMEETNG